MASCASTSNHVRSASNHAPEKFESAAQASWERGGVEASADYHFSLAQAYSHDGKVDRAIEEFRAALAHDPKSAVIHAKLAAEYLRKGAMSFAIEECQKSLELDPHSVDVRLMLGGVYSLNNEMDLALNEYEQVLKVDPSNDEAAVFKTQVLVEKQKYEEALQFIRKFTTKVKDSAAAWFYLGKMEHSTDHTHEAIRAFRHAIDLRPGFSQASLALGLLFESIAQNPKAVEVYTAQMEEKPDMHVAGRLVTIHLKENRTDEALRILQTMTAMDPEDLNTRLRMGLITMQKGDWAGARVILEALLEKVPDSDKVNYYLGAIYEQEGRIEDTLKHLIRVSPDSKLFEDAFIHAAGIYRRRNESAKAFALIRDAVKRAPENAGFYLLMASMFEDEKKIKEANAALSDGLKIFPEDLKLRYFHGAMLEKLGDTEAAVREMEKILEKTPDHADALNFVAYTWTVQGVRLKDAETMLKRAMKIKPNNPFILDSFGWNQFVLGKHQNALKFLEKAVGLKGDEETILQHLLEAYAKNQMPERARETQGRIESLQSKDPSRVPASVEQK
ncbi:MAG: tetratricopeptide repeat protein [Bdellovibrionales bacterium]|nr:tetratricopeptide repeat protein [Bdellovibrionales bacterium]